VKRGYIVILIVLWSLAFAHFINNKKASETDIVTAFSNDMFLSTNSHIEAVALCGNNYVSEEAKVDIIKSVAGKLGIKDYTLGCASSEKTQDNRLVATSKYANTEIKFVTVKNENDALVKRQYLMIDISISNSLESAVLYRDKVEDILETMNYSAEVTLTHKGNISGNLSLDEKNSITDDIIKSLNAQIVTERRDEKIYTVYAYTEAIDDYVVNGTSKTNVNVAISYDETLNETNIYMATPIINEDY